MEPNIWGPAGWIFLHSITFNYPENPNYDEKQIYQNFFENLKFVLPCPNCQKHYAENIRKHPIRLDTRKELIEWLIDIHNEVNIINNKKTYSYQEVYQKYNNLYAPRKEVNYIGYIFLFFISICIILYYLPSLNEK
tara:strand:+ start:5479 stop:5886 length:408 start_codon:yes stop_codon:yes gene_type:complete